MTILYTDTNGNQRIEADSEQCNHILQAVRVFMLYRSDFDLLHIDLRSESCEEVSCYDLSCQRRVCSFGGAAAWHIYREVAAVFQQINHHLAGRPPVIL